MKIAFLVNKFPSISETFILNQIVGLVSAGHQVDIYARNAQATSKVHPLIEKYNLVANTYYHPDISANSLMRYLKGLWLIVAHIWQAPRVVLKSLNFKKYRLHSASFRLLYRSIPFIQNNCPRYDIVMCHFGFKGLLALDLQEIGALTGKLCVAFHGNDLSAYPLQAGETVYKSLLQHADLVLPISEFWEKRLLELGCSPSKVQVHHMGIDVEQFAFQARTLPKDGIVKVVSIARLVEKKGIEYGIRAIAEVAKHHPKIEYTVIGDGRLMDELSQLIDDLQLTSTVKLVGWKQQDEVVKILDNSHILLAPSVTSSNGDMEGIPVVLMEAMAMGLPVVSTLHSGIPELVNHGRSGFLVPERDSLELASQIVELIRQPERWKQFGEEGRATVTEHYEINKLNRQLLNTFLNMTTLDHSTIVNKEALLI